MLSNIKKMNNSPQSRLVACCFKNMNVKDVLQQYMSGVRDFNGVAIDIANLSDRRLMDIDFSQATLDCASFTRSDLRGADFSHASLRRTSLWQANCSFGRFVEAQMGRSDPRGLSTCEPTES